jgi:hypothetical protein
MAQNYDQYATSEKFYNSGTSYNACRFANSGQKAFQEAKMTRDAFLQQ